MRTLIVIIISVFSFSCSKNQSDDENSKKEEIDSIELGIISEFDSTMYDQNFTRKIDLSTLAKVDNNSTSVAGCAGFVSNESEIFLVEETNSGKVILNSSIAGRYLYYVSENGTCLELTKDKCDLMEYNEEFELSLCDVMVSFLVNNQLNTIREAIWTKEFSNESVTIERDSVSIVYDMSNQMKILSRDSVRLTY